MSKQTEAMKLQTIMEQAQVFASAWSLVGGRFDGGNAMDDAEVAKNELRQMVAEALAKQPAQQEPVALPEGKKLILVDGSFDDLMYWLERCEDKGHLENCLDLVEPWENFSYEECTTPPAQQEPVGEVSGHDWSTGILYRDLEPGAPLYTSPPAQQEPVEYWTVANGWVSDQAEVPAAVWVEPDFWEHCNRVNCGTAYRLPAPGRQPLYTSPPAQRKPLTDEEIETVWGSVQANDFHDCVKPFARAIEAAHNIKGDA